MLLLLFCFDLHPPRQVHYLRPSFGLHDLELWKDGLCGLNNNVHATSTMTAPTVTSAEAAAIQADLHSRCVYTHIFGAGLVFWLLR